MSHTIDRIDGIATHYGFQIMRAPTTVHIDGEIFLRPEEKIPVLKNYLRDKIYQPGKVSMLYHNQAILTNNRLRKKNSAQFQNFNFDILGVPNSIAEATIIHTATIALNAEGYQNIVVDINSIGDKNSLLNFKEELFNYYRSQIQDAHPKCSNFCKTNILDWFSCSHSECQALRATAPKPIYFLSNQSQRHLKEILEYLESMQIAYRINETLVSPSNYFSKIIFEIKSEKNVAGQNAPNSHGANGQGEILLGRGGRYDELAEKIIRKKIMPAVGISLGFERIKNKDVKSVPCCSPKFYFIHLGPEAKLKSLPIIELLRSANFSVQQNLYTNKFSEQMENAKKSGAPYTIILGQKEATENKVIVKDMRQITHTTLKLDFLLNYLKTLDTD